MGAIFRIFFSAALLVVSASQANAQECPANMHRSRCVSACPRTCAYLHGPICEALICNNSCECDEGYVLVESGSNKYVPSSQCGNCGKPGFKYNECGSACNNTCEDILEGRRTCKKPRSGCTCKSKCRKVCTKQCVAGCYCENGVYDEKKEKCVPEEEC